MAVAAGSIILISPFAKAEMKKPLPGAKLGPPDRNWMQLTQTGYAESWVYFLISYSWSSYSIISWYRLPSLDPAISAPVDLLQARAVMCFPVMGVAIICF